LHDLCQHYVFAVQLADQKKRIYVVFGVARIGRDPEYHLLSKARRPRSPWARRLTPDAAARRLCALYREGPWRDVIEQAFHREGLEVPARAAEDFITGVIQSQRLRLYCVLRLAPVGSFPLEPTAPPAAAPQVITEPPRPDRTTPTWFELLAVDAWGEPIASVPFHLLVDSKTMPRNTDGGGRIRVDSAEGSRFASARVVDLGGVWDTLTQRTEGQTRGAMLEQAEERTFFPITSPVATPDTRVQLTKNTPRLVVFRRVRLATVMTIPSFDLGRAIFMPDRLATAPSGRHSVTGIGCIAQILSFARDNPERPMLVVGHADASGTDRTNDELSAIRAEHVSALLRGDVETWVRIATEHGEAGLFDRMLRWVARRFGWDTDFGDTPSDEQREAAFDSFRENARASLEIAVSTNTTEPQRDDWRAMMALHDRALAEELALDADAFESFRESLRLCDPVRLGLGERWPKTCSAGEAEPAEAQRRVEVLFFADETSVPELDPEGATLYGADTEVQREYVDPPLRVDLPVTLLSEFDHPIPEVAVELTASNGARRRATLDAHGSTTFYDVPAGEYELVYLAPEEIEAKAWAAAARAAIEGIDFSALHAILLAPRALLRKMAEAYASLYGSVFEDDASQTAQTAAERQDADFRLFEAELVADAPFTRQPPRARRLIGSDDAQQGDRS